METVAMPMKGVVVYGGEAPILVVAAVVLRGIPPAEKPGDFNYIRS